MDKNIQISTLAKDMGIAFQLAGTTRFGPVAENLVNAGYCKIEDAAAEIFAWIDSMMFDAKIDGKYDVKVIHMDRYEALKKKYERKEQ